MTPQPSFLIASPRSGTTWAQTALNAHPDIACIEQRLLGMHADLVRDAHTTTPRLRVTLDRYVHALTQHLAPGDPESRTRPKRDELLADISAAITTRVRDWSGARVVVDKITPYEGTADAVVERLNAVFPGATVSHLVRDGRDVAVSGVMHWLNKALEGDARTPAHARRRRWLVEGRADEAMDRLFLPGELERWARTWREPTLALKDAVSAGTVEVFRYEALLDDPMNQFAHLVAHHGGSADAHTVAACIDASSFERMSGGRARGDDRPGAHVRNGVAGDWRRWFTREDGQRFAVLAGDTLGFLGYEKADEWWADLPERLGPISATPAGANA